MDKNDQIAIGIVSAFVLASVIVFFCIAVVRLYFRKIRNYTRLLYENEIEFQKTLNTTIIETQEQTLVNIAQDLHDDIGQQLTYLNLQIENARLDQPEISGTLAPLGTSLATLADAIRGISHALHNQSILKQDLAAALETEVSRLNKNRLPQFRLTVVGRRETSLPQDHKIVVYRIFQEAVNNILKHARAKTVTVILKWDPFVLEIADDGKGFDPAANNPADHSLGLGNLHRRAALIGCTLSIVSSPGQGTTVRLSTENTRHGKN